MTKNDEFDAELAQKVRLPQDVEPGFNPEPASYRPNYMDRASATPNATPNLRRNVTRNGRAVTPVSFEDPHRPNAWSGPSPTVSEDSDDASVLGDIKAALDTEISADASRGPGDYDAGGIMGSPTEAASSSEEEISQEAIDWLRENEQRKRALREQKGLRLRGPCFMCDRQTEYGVDDVYGLYGRFGNKWLDRQFDGSTRAEHVKALIEGDNVRGARIAIFKQFVCEACRRKTEDG